MKLRLHRSIGSILGKGTALAALAVSMVSASATTDLTSNVVVVGALAGTGTANGLSAYARNIWDMKLAGGRIYLGNGNCANQGPAINSASYLVYYDTTSNAIVYQNASADCQLGGFRDINGTITIPGMDTVADTPNGNLYQLQTNQSWLQINTVPGAVHITDAAYLNGKVWVSLGSNTDQIMYSADGCQTWQGVGLTPNFIRRSSIFAFNNKVYSIAYLNSGAASIQYQVAEITGTTCVLRTDLSAKNLMPEKHTTGGSTCEIQNEFVWNGKLYYIGGDNWDDIQMNPFAVWYTSSLDVGSPNSTRVPTATGDKPWDVLGQADAIYVLASQKVTGTPEQFINKVYKSTDGVTWAEYFRFTTVETFARSMEKNGTDFYFGLGTDVGTAYNAGSYTTATSEYAGRILKVGDPSGPPPPPPPAAPTGLTATPGANQVVLSWTASTGATSYNVKRSTTSGGPYTTVGSPLTTGYTDTAVSSGATYYYVVTAANGGGESGNSAQVTATLPAGIPSPWVQANIGPVNSGSGSYASGTFTLNGGGTTISGTADSFHFIYQTVSGDCTITAREVSLTGFHHSLDGVMIRGSLATNAVYADTVMRQSTAGSYYGSRPTVGGTGTFTFSTAGSPPNWMRVKRVGSTFTHQISTNGTTWTTIATSTVTMGTTVYVGMVQCNGDDTTVGSSTYDSVSVTTP